MAREEDEEGGPDEEEENPDEDSAGKKGKTNDTSALAVSFEGEKRKPKVKKAKEDVEEDAEEPSGEDEETAKRDEGLDKLSCKELKAKVNADEEDASAKLGNATEDEEEGIKEVAEASMTKNKKKKLELEEQAAQREERAEEEADVVEEDMEQAAKIQALIKSKCSRKAAAVEDENVEEPIPDGNAKKEEPKED